MLSIIPLTKPLTLLNNFSRYLFRITLKWVDKRFVEKKKDGVVSYNEHRQTECPSNEITFEDTLLLWKPNLRVLNSLRVVNAKSTL